jgi:putative methionine-R-sulfoxide reductase with GAF domain
MSSFLSRTYVKSYRSTQSILSDIQNLLANNRPSFQHSPLEDVAELLCEGRHYSWAGIYLTLDQKTSPALLKESGNAHLGQLKAAGTRKKILVAMKVGGREIGSLNVESDRENSFGSEDRVLLERVANLLARFLAGSGKYLVLKASKPAPVPKAAAA